MAVVNVNSGQIGNDLLTPPVLNNPYVAGGIYREMVDVCAMGATDSAGSTYRFFRIPSNARVGDVEVMNDANATGTSYKCGVLFSNGGSTVVAGSDALYIPSGTSLAAARQTWTSLYFPAIAGAGAAVANIPKRIWELLGLASDPGAIYDVVVTAVTAGTAGGNLSLKMAYVQ